MLHIMCSKVYVFVCGFSFMIKFLIFSGYCFLFLLCEVSYLGKIISHILIAVIVGIWATSCKLPVKK